MPVFLQRVTGTPACPAINNDIHCSRFGRSRIINMQAKPEHYFPEWRLTLDTLEDLKVITEIYKHFEGIHFHYDEVINYLQENPELLKINNKIQATKLEAEPCK